MINLKKNYNAKFLMHTFCIQCIKQINWY